MPRILQISDTHVAMPPRLVSKKLNTLSLLKDAIDQILGTLEQIGPLDAVVATGDIADQGDLESYRAFRDEIERLKLPYFLVPGNHDCREPMRMCFQDLAFMPETGKINWVQDFGEMRLIGLDTLIEGEGGGRLDQSSLNFMVQALAAAPAAPTLIAMHHPPFKSGLQFMDKIGLSGIEALESALRAAANDVRIICGHVHNTIVGEIGKRVAIVGASTVSRFPTDYRDNAPIGFATHPVGYMVHDWEGGFRSAYVPMASGTNLHAF